VLNVPSALARHLCCRPILRDDGADDATTDVCNLTPVAHRAHIGLYGVYGD
jgi:hypothetical protein